MTQNEFKLAIINAKLEGKLYKNGKCALMVKVYPLDITN
jgi:hypothetical protein